MSTLRARCPQILRRARLLSLTIATALAAPTSAAASGPLVVNGTVALPSVPGGYTYTSLAGQGFLTVNGNAGLTLTQAQDTFIGTIQSDSLTLVGGAQTIRGQIGIRDVTVNDARMTVEGATTLGNFTVVNGGTFALVGNSSEYPTQLTTNGQGTFDISGANGRVTVERVAGDSGSIDLGANTLSIRDTGEGNLVYGGVIRGTGGLRFEGGKYGYGELVIVNDQRYTGPSTFTGTVTLGTGGVHGSVVGDIELTGAFGQLVVDRSDIYALPGVISGSQGQVVQAGTGTLVLDHDNTYALGTLVQAGTLEVGSQSALGSGSLTMMPGTTFHATHDVGVAGLTAWDDTTYDVDAGATANLAMAPKGLAFVPQSGGGTYTKTGAGTLVVGYLPITSVFDVDGGTLQVNGAAASIDIRHGGTLAGNGRASSATIEGGASISPGSDAIGTLSVGTLHVMPGSQYVVDVNNRGGADLILMNHATLDGGIVAVRASGAPWDVSTRYTILSDGGFTDSSVTGEFSAVTSNLTFLSPVLSYDAAAVYLRLVRNDVAFESVATTANQASVAHAISLLSPFDPIYASIAVLDPALARNAFDQLSGASIASARTAIVDDSRNVREAIASHGRAGHAADTIWTSAWGHWGDNDGAANTVRQSNHGGGVIVGAERELDEVSVGAVLAHGELVTSAGADETRARSNHAGLYASTELDHWQFQGGVIYTNYDGRTHRNIDIPNLSSRSDGPLHVNLTQAFGEAGYRVDGGCWSFMPYMNLARTWYHHDSERETGSVASLDIDGGGSAVNAGTAGVHGALAASGDVTVHGDLGYVSTWGDRAPRQTQHFTGDATSMTIAGTPIARHGATAELGATFRVGRRTTVDASYEGRFSGAGADQSARISAQWAL